MRNPWVVSLIFGACLTGCPDQSLETPIAATPEPPQAPSARRELPAEVNSAKVDSQERDAPEAIEPQASAREPTPARAPLAKSNDAPTRSSAKTPADDLLSLGLLGDVAGDAAFVDIDPRTLGGDLDRKPLTREEEMARLREQARVPDDEAPPAAARSKRKRAPRRSANLRWHESYAKARREAQRKRRPILAFFTGSDWCGWCMRLKGEVFDKAQFKTWASKKVVLLVLDFPKKHALPAAQQRQNQELASRYKITGYPTVLFLAADGKVVGRSGYLKGGPGAWTQNADKQLAARR